MLILNLLKIQKPINDNLKITQFTEHDNLKITLYIRLVEFLGIFLHQNNYSQQDLERQMIITTINNNKLFIQFDRLVKNGLIHIYDGNEFEKNKYIKNSEFEVIELPVSIEKIQLEIDYDNKRKISKTISINQ